MQDLTPYTLGDNKSCLSPLMRLMCIVFSLCLWGTAQAAIGTGGATCTNQSKTAGTSLACTVATQNLEAGNIAVLWFAGDNTATVDGNDGLLSSVTDSAQNVWTVQRCYTNSQGAAASGATTCIAMSKLSRTLTSGSATITANFSSITAKAIVVREFTVGAGNALTVIGTPQDLPNDAADPGSMTVGGLANVEHLFIRSTALERAGGGTWTVTGSYTTSNCNGTAVGTTTNMESCGEFRILTATTDTSNPTGTAVDNASIFMAFNETSACPGNQVTTTADGGIGSLRECINYANANAGTTISFNIAGTNQASGGDAWNRITIPSSLPAITANGTIIDGTTQTTNQGNTNTLGPEIEVYAGAAGLTAFTLTSNTNTLKGVVIDGPFNVGVSITGNSNTVSKSYIGTDATGATSPTVASGNKMLTAIDISGGGSSNTIGGATAADGNLISGTSDTVDMIWIHGSTTQLNLIRNNYIGTNRTGTAAIGNAEPSDAVVFTDGTHDNTVQENLISGNGYGVILAALGAVPNLNTVKGNKIGTNLAGTAAVANTKNGIANFEGTNTTIGGTLAADRNVISGNAWDGIYLTSASTTNTIVRGNYIGTNAAGTAAIPNGMRGIELANGCSNTIIGGATAGAGNIISGNAWTGISVFNCSTTTIYGNTIGTGVAGTENLGNGLYGIEVATSASSVQIGGLLNGQGNTIAWTPWYGIKIFDTAGAGTIIQGNTLHSNTAEGIAVDHSGVLIEKNVSRNNWHGIALWANGSGALIYHNTLNGNTHEGLWVSAGLTGVVAKNNILSNNAGWGIWNNGGASITSDFNDFYLNTSGTCNSCTSGNYNLAVNPDFVGGANFNLNPTSPLINAGCKLGTAADDTWCDATVDTVAQPDLTNGGSGSGYYDFAPEMGAYEVNTASACPSVQSTASGGASTLRDCINYANNNAGTTISFNISGGCPSGCTIQPTSLLPYILAANTTINGYSQPGASANTLPFPNTDAVLKIELNGALAGAVNGLVVSANNVTIKGLSITGFSSGWGLLAGAGYSGRTLAGNYVGIKPDGATTSANSLGILTCGTSDNIGTGAAADRNLISGNTNFGIYNCGTSTSIKNNFIGADAGGTLDKGNGNVGIYSAGASTTIGGTGANDKNLISANKLNGIVINAYATNTIQGNYIGTQKDGVSALGNTGDGILIQTNATGTTVGGTAAGQANVIAYNSNHGVELIGSGSDNNQISGNSIFSNTNFGIQLDGAGSNNDKPKPIVLSMEPNGLNYIVRASVTSGDTVEFFRASNAAAPVVTADGSGYGEGYLYLGKCVDNGAACSGPHINAVADADATAGILKVTLLSTGLSAGDTLSATASDASNGTSPFSQNLVSPAVSTCRVNTTADASPTAPPGSLRDCINFANSRTGADTISFNILGCPAGLCTITSAAAMPALSDATGGTTIDGYTQTGATVNTDANATNAALKVVLDGAGAAYYGLTLSSASNVVKGLVIKGFTGANSGGIYINGASSTGNLVSGNFIGILADGATAGANLIGVDIRGGATNNTVGGTTAAARNLISCNSFGGSGSGIFLGATASGNTILGNNIGLNAAGTGACSNRIGIDMYDSASNTIGGTDAGARNVISGNATWGISIGGTPTGGSTILGNWIGTNAAGDGAVANGVGVNISSLNGTTFTIGGTAAGASNVISGNTGDGITHSAATGALVVQGNYIGTNASSASLPNGGIGLSTSAGTISLGNAGEAQSNIIGPNTGVGLSLTGGTVNLAGTVTVNDDVTLSTGALSMGSATLNVSGNWTRTTATVTPATSTVILNGANQSITGDTTFNNLTKSVTTARTLTFAAGSTTTINGTATLNGASGQLLSLVSSTPGTYWNFNLGAASTKAISYVSVTDSNASGSDASKKPVSPANSTDGGHNVSWFGAGASLTFLKTVAVYSDPVNGTGANRKYIPGAYVDYTMRVTNSGVGQVDNNTLFITDPIPANTELFTGNLSGGKPFIFADGTPSSGLSCAFIALGDFTDCMDFSNDSGATWTYVPNGSFDPAVNKIRFSLGGAMTGDTGSGGPYFDLSFRVRVQ